MQLFFAGTDNPHGARPTVEAQAVLCKRTGARIALRASIDEQPRGAGRGSPGAADDFGSLPDAGAWFVRIGSRM